MPQLDRQNVRLIGCFHARRKSAAGMTFHYRSDLTGGRHAAERAKKILLSR
jgi:hypothetical protein